MNPAALSTAQPLVHAPLSWLAPVFALAGWTLLVLVLVAWRRVRAALRGELSPSAFTLGETAAVPPLAVQANRNYMNLLELPVLFYVGCLVAWVAQPTAPALVPLAWAYVVLRVVHSLVHLSYNHVMHRFAVFAASNLVLALFWVLLGLALWRGAGG